MLYSFNDIVELNLEGNYFTSEDWANRAEKEDEIKKQAFDSSILSLVMAISNLDIETRQIIKEDFPRVHSILSKSVVTKKKEEYRKELNSKSAAQKEKYRQEVQEKLEIEIREEKFRRNQKIWHPFEALFLVLIASQLVQEHRTVTRNRIKEMFICAKNLEIQYSHKIIDRKNDSAKALLNKFHTQEIALQNAARGVQDFFLSLENNCTDGLTKSIRHNDLGNQFYKNIFGLIKKYEHKKDLFVYHAYLTELEYVYIDCQDGLKGDMKRIYQKNYSTEVQYVSQKYIDLFQFLEHILSDVFFPNCKKFCQLLTGPYHTYEGTQKAVYEYRRAIRCHIFIFYMEGINVVFPKLSRKKIMEIRSKLE